MTKIAVIGTGYVGLTTGACFAHLGHDVVCADIDEAKVDGLRNGVIPIVELGLEELVREGVAGGRLSFVVGAAEAARDCEIAFLCVPTPQGEDGSADLSYIEAAAREIGPVLPYEAVVVNKSTVPVGSAKVVERVLGRPDIKVVSNPEFLREGSAVQDFLKPDRVVVGCDDQAAALKVASLYMRIGAPLIVTDPASAETIKYAANAFLATKLSFINAIAAICEGVGADVNDVVVGMGSDKRIGQEFLRPGPGWGGSCFAGTETCIVRDRFGTRLVAFEDLGTADADSLEVLSWSEGQIVPEFQPALAWTSRPYSGTFVDIRTKMGRRLRVTGDHPMIVSDGAGEISIKLARDLDAEDWLPISLGSPVHGSIGAEHASMVEAIHHSGIPWRDVIVRLTEQQVAAARRQDSRLPAPRRSDYRRSRTLRLTQAAMLRLPLTGALLGTATNGTYVPLNIDLTDDFWEVLGLYLAEGYITTDGLRQRIAWTFHPRDEMRLVSCVRDFWTRLGVKTSTHVKETACQISISSRLLASWLEHVLNVGRDCYGHRIPDIAWSASVSAKQALLRGLWAGDGSWSLVNGGPSVVLEFGTASPALADGVLRLLAELGIVARQKIGRTARSTVDTHWVTISGADQIEACTWLLEEHERSTVLAHIAGQSKRIAPTGYRIDRKGTAWVRVHEARHSIGEDTVYSVEVARNHTVVTTGGLVAHNCFPKDSRALLKIARDAGYDFGLLDGVIAVNDEQFERVAAKIRAAAGGTLDGATVAVWGLTFKARTDDLRDSPSLAIVDRLLNGRAKVQAYDPTVKGPKQGIPSGITIADTPYAACQDADVLAVLTEWDEFRWLDIEQVKAAMSGRAIVDARNLLERNAWRRAGFDHQGIGR